MIIIALEGIDACGKETQTIRLFNWLDSVGLKVKLVSFPRYYTPIGKQIEEYLNGYKEIDPYALSVLYEMDRIDYINYVIKEDIDVLVCDRYTLSNYAYSVAKGVPKEWITYIQRSVPKPNLNIVLDIGVQTSFERRPDREDRNEKDEKLLENVRKNYLSQSILQEHGVNTSFINGESSIEEVSKIVISSTIPILWNNGLISINGKQENND